MLADPGANSGCCNTFWAIKNFKDYICKNNKHSILNTANGKCNPKYIVNFTYPTNNGFYFVSKLFLIDNLPVNVIADINLLEAFGYKFVSEIPPIFKHKAQSISNDVNLNYHSDLYKISKYNYTTDSNNSFKNYNNIKNSNINISNDVSIIDKAYCFDKCILNNTSNNNILSKIRIDSNEMSSIEDINSNENDINIIHKFDFKLECKKLADGLKNTMNELNSMNNDLNTKLDNLDTQLINDINNDIKMRNELYNKIGMQNNNNNNNIENDLNFMHASQSMIATNDEIAKAKELYHNIELKFNKFDHVKILEKSHKKYNGLYNELIRLIEKYKHCFAKRLYDRQTIKNIKPVNLGIKPECRNEQCYQKQYPLSKQARAHMINFTQVNIKNGLFTPVDSTVHLMPYTMVAKKPLPDGYIRQRPASDARIGNSKCKLIITKMPTQRTYDEFFAIPGLITLWDFKNFFDCIPLIYCDRIWAVIETPLGLMKFNCISYGWKNAAPHAQNITNTICAMVGNTLGYIDDITQKHPIEWGTAQLIAHLEKFLKVIEYFGILLHPTKFVPFCTSVEVMGIQRSIYGSTVTVKYRMKILELKKPETSKQLQMAIGVIIYIARYLYMISLFIYWLNQLLIKFKNKRILIWDKQANDAWDTIQELVRNAPILYYPNPKGMFAIKPDACNYGIGSVLYQLQWDNKLNKNIWRIIDMFSQIIPKSMRMAHTSVHEGYAIGKSCQHWVFHLLKRPFLITTDHKPLLKLFDDLSDLTDITRKQLLRIRIAISEFEFEIRHVSAINNELADLLSRFLVKLKQINGNPILRPIVRNDINNPKVSDFELNCKFNNQSKLIKNGLNLIQFENNDLCYLYNTYKNEKLHTFQNIINKGSFSTDFDIFNDIVYYNKYHTFGNFNDNSNINTKSNNLVNLIDKLDKGLSLYINNDMKFNTNLILNNSKNVKSRLHQFVNKQSLLYLNNTDSDLNINQFGMLKLLLKPKLINTINKQSNKLRNILITSMNDAFELSYNLNYIDNNNNNKNKFEHNCYITDYNDILPTHTYNLRSKHVKKKENKFEYIQPSLAELEERMNIRNECMNQLFSTNDNHTFLDINNIGYEQQNDGELHIIIQYLQRDKNIPLSIQFKNKLIELSNDSPKLYESMMNGTFEINNNLLTTRQTDDLTKKWINKIIVPSKLRGKLILHAHHNIFKQHFGQSQTYDNISKKFWWPSMRIDVNKLVRACTLCQFIKQGVSVKAPLLIRDLPKPRSHIMIDFIGPLFNHKYYIMVIVDYATGYTMLHPCTTCDTLPVIHALLSKWIPFVGLFNIIETDLGSAFNSKLIKKLLKSLKTKQLFSEPRNHMGTGKVERIIGFIQQILNAFNVELNGAFVEPDDTLVAWETMQAVLPFIQFSINQKHSRFTGVSPHMLMFGTNLDEIEDIKICTDYLQRNLKKLNNLEDEEYTQVDKLINTLQLIHKQYSNDWMKYMLETKRVYDTKNNVNKYKYNNDLMYKPGSKVVYYVGDRQVVGKKWRQRWSGPWTICDKINDRTIIITNDDLSSRKTVSINRCKLYKNTEFENAKIYNRKIFNIVKLNKNKLNEFNKFDKIEKTDKLIVNIIN